MARFHISAGTKNGGMSAECHHLSRSHVLVVSGRRGAAERVGRGFKHIRTFLRRWFILLNSYLPKFPLYVRQEEQCYSYFAFMVALRTRAFINIIPKITPNTKNNVELTNSI